MLTRGTTVRVRRAGSADEWCRGWVAVASDTQPSSVMLLLKDAVRTGDGGMILGALPLTVDYQAETAVSLLGDAYEIEVAH